MNNRVDFLAKLSMLAFGISVMSLFLVCVLLRDLRKAQAGIAIHSVRVEALEKRVGLTWETPWEKIKME